MVSELLPLPGAAMVAGANVAVMPAGGFAASAMAPLNPAPMVLEIETTADAPWAIETLVDEALIVNVAGVVTTTLSEAVSTVDPLVAVIGMV